MADIDEVDTPTPALSPPLHNTASPRDQEPETLEKIQKWQEERMARKLRGEYQSAVLHLSDVIQQNLSTSMDIASVRVEGAKATRSSFLASIINPVLSSRAPEVPSNLQSVLHTTRHISHLLQKTDIFQSVDARLERSQDELSPAGSVDLVFKTREKGRFYLNTATELGNNEGNASATGRIRNLFGGAETLEANVTFGTKTRRAFRASLAAPLSSDLDTHGELQAYGTEQDQRSWASSVLGVRGVKGMVRRGDISRGGAHEFAYEAVLRHIGDLTPEASISMREAAGKTLKSSISHTYVFDTRDDRYMATRGAYFKSFAEYAGIGGGDAKHAKAEVEAQASRPLMEGVSVSLAARSGFLLGLGGRPTLFADRFQLGGPTSVRAFKANGLGPMDGPDSLGGDLHWSTGASLIADVPTKPTWPVKLHAWVNAGRLDALDQSEPLVTAVRRTLTAPSVSAGVGLIYRFDPVRVEVNFGVPLVKSASDQARRGVQVGMGLEFL
ncbi:hypothetical protein H0H81_010230 [Sphagnurus paluster]|uniref:Bacterial surface antigen (D15) domain-containing protein n=1 Tax=Sphagnurus paluster TaxID=117069 RepID=A0A9P7GQ79_9AGAR|nr:hypothetical protein H0H81_010230 [Sphagnurus paluster]